MCTRVCQSFHMPAKPPLFSRIVFGGKNEPWRGQENLSLTQAGHERAGVASYTRSTAFAPASTAELTTTASRTAFELSRSFGRLPSTGTAARRSGARGTAGEGVSFDQILAFCAGGSQFSGTYFCSQILRRSPDPFRSSTNAPQPHAWPTLPPARRSRRHPRRVPRP